MNYALWNIYFNRSHSNRNQGYDVPAPNNLKNTPQTLHKKAFRSYNSNPRYFFAISLLHIFKIKK